MMKDKIFTVAAMGCLLGVYSASIYHFSLGNIHDKLHNEAGVPSPSNDVEDVEKIMRAVQLQGPVRVQTNLPIPGAQCSITLDELLEDTAQPLDAGVLSCLDTLNVGTQE